MQGPALRRPPPVMHFESSTLHTFGAALAAAAAPRTWPEDLRGLSRFAMPQGYSVLRTMGNFDGSAFGAYTRSMTFFQKHPTLHKVVDYAMVGVGFILATQDQLLAAAALFPEGSNAPRFIGYGLGVLAFSKILFGRVQVAGDGKFDSAAPTVPASEAVTKVERPDPEKSA
jgi:hypothetical protein